MDDSGGCDAGDVEGFREGAMNTPEEARPVVGGYGQSMRLKALEWRVFGAAWSDEEGFTDES